MSTVQKGHGKHGGLRCLGGGQGTRQRSRLMLHALTKGIYQSGEIGSITGGANGKRFGVNTRGNASKLLVCKNNTPSRANLSIGR